ETPEKSAQPSALQSVQASANVALQTIAQVAQRSWIQSRPTVLQGMQVLTRSLQTWSTQLEFQERTAQARGTVPAQAIDWTPLKRLTDSLWSKAQPLWQRLLTLLRPRLPESFQPLSDRSLSGILVGVLLLVLWFVSIVPSGQAAPPPNSPSQPSRQTNQLSRQSGKTALSSDYNSDYSSDRESVSIAIPSDLSSPIAQPVAPADRPPAVTPSFLTPDILSPDAQKRAKLRQDLDVIAGSLIDNAIVGIRPQFDSHFLAITLDNQWYATAESTQDKLANSLLVIAQVKGFTQIQLEGSDGAVLARNPVVGDGMIILLRSR
ncbi:MAG: hypothetical protein H7237_09220, partial [Alkalinema sp. FL-bin-369]|nr:hypothetical protein [Leptolyngbyaceae cyanobacterium LF-bin-369]